MNVMRCDDCRQWKDDQIPAILCTECSRRYDIAIIRAFVERVEKRVTTYDISDNFLWNVVREELAAMEKENE